jgi:hypothetical protein
MTAFQLRQARIQRNHDAAWQLVDQLREQGVKCRSLGDGDTAVVEVYDDQYHVVDTIRFDLDD